MMYKHRHLGGYEDAPSTKMLATNCAFCGKELRDAPSIERGYGPICANKYGMPHGMDPNDRAEANKLIHEAAVYTGQEKATKVIKRLLELGCTRAAEQIAKYSGNSPELAIQFDPYAAVWEVFVGRYIPEWISESKKIPGLRRQKVGDRWLAFVPYVSSRELLSTMQTTMPNSVVKGKAFSVFAGGQGDVTSI